MGFVQNLFAHLLLSEDELLIYKAQNLLLYSKENTALAEGLELSYKAISINPANPHAFLLKGEFLYSLRRYREAKEAFIRSLEICYVISKKCKKDSNEYNNILLYKKTCLTFLNDYQKYSQSEIAPIIDKYDF